MRQIKKWSKEEIDLLIKEYPNTKTEELAQKLNRTYGSVSKMARRLGLKKTLEYLSRMKSEISPSRKRTMERAKQIEHEIQKEDLIYIAGLFDGEGSVTLCVKKDKHRIKNVFLEAQIANTNREVLEWIKNLFKLGSIYKGNKVRKQTYHYFVAQWRAFVFLKTILPFLKIKRKSVLDKLEKWLKVHEWMDYKIV